MWAVLLLISLICSAVVGAPVTVTGQTGEKVDIKCRYECGYETYSKYFCKGKCKPGSKVIKVESGSPAKDERFSLTDNKMTRVLTVTITDLRTEDRGQYWCAVRRTFPLPDVYSEVLLLIEETSVTGSSTVQLHHPITKLAFVTVGSVLLILCSGTFFILKKRKRDRWTASVQHNVLYNIETGRNPGNTHSANQMPASDQEIATVYATVTNQQPDLNPRHTQLTNQMTYGNI